MKHSTIFLSEETKDELMKLYHKFKEAKKIKSYDDLIILLMRRSKKYEDIRNQSSNKG
jgi:hypothetical protein